MTASSPGRTASEPGDAAEPQVRAMFDRIAGVYDRMNAVMTAGLHHHWRAARGRSGRRLGPGARVLDVATGTGDLALELARRVAPGGVVVGADFSEAMLELARAKAGRRAGFGRELRFEAANALDLPYADDDFDAATVGFGARNFSDLRRGLAEMARVVGPAGGSWCSRSPRPPGRRCRRFLELWFDRIVPALGRLAGDPDAYSYLPNSVRRFPGPEELAAICMACRAARCRLPADRRRHHRAARRHGGEPVTGAQASVQAVVEAGGEPAARLMAALEAADGRARRRSRRAARPPRRSDDRRRRQAAAPAARVPGRRRAPAGDRRLLRAAVAVELVHSATLVHDDVLDGSDLRRGRPTVAAAGGRLTATATGDLLFSRAFAELAGPGRGRRCGRSPGRAPSWPPVSSCSAPTPGGWSPVERYLERCRLKTAVLFRAACELGALAGQARATIADALAAFGERIGLAFQLLDDVLDVSGPPERTGKPRGADLLDGTVTLPLILARERDPGAGRARCAHACAPPRRRPRCASGSPPPARWRRSSSARWRWSSPPSASCRAAGAPAGRAGAGRRRRRRALRLTGRGVLAAGAPAITRGEIVARGSRSPRGGSSRPPAPRRSGRSPRPCSPASADAGR